MIKGKFNFKELERYQKKLEKMSKESNEMIQFYQLCAKEIAARLLALVIPRTPVAENTTYIDAEGREMVMKNGGTLRRGWVSKSEKEAESGTIPGAKEAYEYAQSLIVIKEGNEYVIEIVNPVHYASYVENGHRQEVGRYVPAIGKRLVNSWVDGKFMLKISEEELDSKMSQILEKKIQKFLEECFDGN